VRAAYHSGITILRQLAQNEHGTGRRRIFGGIPRIIRSRSPAMLIYRISIPKDHQYRPVPVTNSQIFFRDGPARHPNRALVGVWP